MLSSFPEASRASEVLAQKILGVKRIERQTERIGPLPGCRLRAVSQSWMTWRFGFVGTLPVWRFHIPCARELVAVANPSSWGNQLAERCAAWLKRHGCCCSRTWRGLSIEIFQSLSGGIRSRKSSQSDVLSLALGLALSRSRCSTLPPLSFILGPRL